MSDLHPLTDDDFSRLADFRYELRRFLYFSESAAAAEQLTPQQHQAMLAIRGNVAGEMNVALLAERLCLKHHTVVELVQRLEKAGLVLKQPSSRDRRAVLLALSPEGNERLDRLVRIHREELAKLGPHMIELLSNNLPSR